MKSSLVPGLKPDLPFPREEYDVELLPALCWGWTLLDSRAPGRTTRDQATGLGLQYERTAIFLRQVHGTRCLQLDDGALPLLPATADGLITHRRDLLLGVSVADCVPLFVVSDRAVAVLHAGWRGVLAGILPLALEELVRHYQLKMSDVRLLVGPHIGPCCFEVSTAVWLLFPEVSRRVRDGRLYLDLASVVDLQWHRSGGSTPPQHLSRCTSCGTPTLHSFRRDAGTGRNFAYLYYR